MTSLLVYQIMARAHLLWSSARLVSAVRELTACQVSPQPSSSLWLARRWPRLLRLLSLAGRRASLLQLRSAACARPAGQAEGASSMPARSLPSAPPLQVLTRDRPGFAPMLCCRKL